MKRKSGLLVGFLALSFASGAFAQSEPEAFVSPEHGHPGGLNGGDYNNADNTGFSGRKARLYHMFCTARDELAPRAARRIGAYLVQAQRRLQRSIDIDEWYDASLENPNVVGKLLEDGTLKEGEGIPTWWHDEGVEDAKRLVTEIESIHKNCSDVAKRKAPRDKDFLLSGVANRVSFLQIDLDAAVADHGDLVEEFHEDASFRSPTHQANKKLSVVKNDRLLARYDTMIKYIEILTTWEGRDLQHFLDLIGK